MKMKTLSLKNCVLIFTLCLVGFGCSGTSSYSNVKGEAYPESVKSEFMKGCHKSGNDTYCTCVFDKVQKEYSLAEFAEIEKKLEAGTPPKEFTDFTAKAASECGR